MVAAPRTLRTGELIGRLIKLDEAIPPPKIMPKALRLRDIHQASDVMQPRTSSLLYAPRQSEDHVRELAVAIKRTKRPLDPITVASFGDKWVVLDGHHRLEAYKLAKWKGDIPVSVARLKHRGAERVREAMVRSATLNVKDKLPMSRDDKLDTAWRLTVLYPEMSKEQVADTASIGTTTVASMRKALRQLTTSGARNVTELAGSQWRMVRRDWEMLQGRDREPGSTEHDERNITLICRGLKDVIRDATGWQLVRALERTQPHLIDELDEAIGTLKGRNLPDL